MSATPDTLISKPRLVNAAMEIEEAAVSWSVATRGPDSTDDSVTLSELPRFRNDLSESELPSTTSSTAEVVSPR